jgi:hypothetical protein
MGRESRPARESFLHGWLAHCPAEGPGREQRVERCRLGVDSDQGLTNEGETGSRDVLQWAAASDQPQCSVEGKDVIHTLFFAHCRVGGRLAGRLGGGSTRGTLWSI